MIGFEKGTVVSFPALDCSADYVVFLEAGLCDLWGSRHYLLVKTESTVRWVLEKQAAVRWTSRGKVMMDEPSSEAEA